MEHPPSDVKAYTERKQDVPDTSTLGLDIKTEPSNTASDQFERGEWSIPHLT